MQRPEAGTNLSCWWNKSSECLAQRMSVGEGHWWERRSGGAAGSACRSIQIQLMTGFILGMWWEKQMGQMQERKHLICIFQR